MLYITITLLLKFLTKLVGFVLSNYLYDYKMKNNIKNRLINTFKYLTKFELIKYLLKLERKNKKD